MKGSDSAMPIWADFMQEALRRHPEWNGDWTIPASVRKAEIDTRNGSLIRELDSAEALATKPSPSPSASPTPKDPAFEDPAWATGLSPTEPEPEIYVTDVPAEFRRVELFIAGTIPNKALLRTDEGEMQYDPETGEPIEPKPKPEPSTTPISGTWEEKVGSGSNNNSTPRGKMVTVFICPISGLRATVNCPKTESRSFPVGKEPRDFCAFHR